LRGAGDAGATDNAWAGHTGVAQLHGRRGKAPDRTTPLRARSDGDQATRKPYVWAKHTCADSTSEVQRLAETPLAPCELVPHRTPHNRVSTVTMKVVVFQLPAGRKVTPRTSAHKQHTPQASSNRTNRQRQAPVSFSTGDRFVPLALFSSLTPRTSGTKRPRVAGLRRRQLPRLAGRSALSDCTREVQTYAAGNHRVYERKRSPHHLSELTHRLWH
jgi:hypothetical protein